MITVHLNKARSLMQKLKHCFASSENSHCSLEIRLILVSENRSVTQKVTYHSLRTRTTELGAFVFLCTSTCNSFT